MKIAILGAGAMGSLLGGKLSSETHGVLLIGREGHMEAVRSSGLKIDGVTEAVSHPRTCTSPEEAEDFVPDMVFITTKAYDTEEAAEEIARAWPDVPVVVSMQNGIGNAGIIAGHLAKSAVITVLTTHGATFLGPGRILHAGTGRTILGQSAGSESKGAEEQVRSVLESAGFEAEISGDIEREVWIKAGINASINPITALLREKNGVIVRSEGLRGIVRDVCREVAETAGLCGISIDAEELLERTITTAEMTADNRSSMLQDVLAGRRTEIEQINGEIVRRASEHGRDAPVTETLYRMVGGLDYVVPNKS